MTDKPKSSSKAKKFPVWGWVALAVVLAAIVGVIVLQPPQQQAVTFPAEITVEQAKQKQEQGAYLLDVREPEEWVQFHIPGATLIPLGQLPDRLKEVPNDQEVIVVCRTGRRSAQGRDILLKAGYTKVTSMTGGVTQWQAQGFPIATGQ